MNTDKKTVLNKLRLSQDVYVMLSKCTRMPFVLCDSETYDDEVLIFFKEDDAKREAEKLIKAGDPVAVIKIEQKNFLPFYSSLFPMGVNGLAVDRGTEDSLVLQLTELVRPPEDKKLPEGTVRIENREFHLTALYFIQELRKKKYTELPDSLKEQQEELLAHYSEGQFIVAVREDKGIVIIKQKEGQAAFVPIFTDIQEFGKFQAANKTDKFKMAAILPDKLQELTAKNAAGVLVNPSGISLPLKIQKRDANDNY